MFKLKEKSCFIYVFMLLALFLIYAPKSFAGIGSCSDSFCQMGEGNCTEICDFEVEGCQWCPNAAQCISDEESCPTAPSVSRSFSQVGGIANSNPSDDWCCGFFANVCAPCGNPALGYSYQVPNACDGAIHYENLWVRCQNSDCNGLSTGSYEVSLCHFDSQDPSSGGGETCGDPCTIDSSNNNCNADFGVGPVPEGEMIYIRIQPTDSPDAPLKGLWSALVEDCSGQAGPPQIECPNNTNSCCTDNGSEPGCNDCDCQMAICEFDSYCCEVEWDDQCAEEANGTFGGDDDDVEFPGCDVCIQM